MPFLNDIQQRAKETEWHATWIHTGFVDRSGVHYFWFYKEFEVLETPWKAELDISADLKYMLYLNDDFIGRGPLYGTPDYYSFDSYDLSKKVTPGKHTLWVLVMQDGPGDYSEKERPLAMLAQLKLTAQDGTVRYIGTDTSWRFFKDNGWVSDTPRSFYDIPVMEAIEVYDARKSINKWNFAESGEESSKALTYSHVRGIRELFEESTISHLGMMWRYLQPRDIPFMLEKDVDGKVVSYGEVEPGNVDKHAFKVVSQMFQNLENVEPVKYTTIENIDAVVKTDDSYALLQAATQPEYPFRSCYPAFIVDFGEIMNGYVQFDVDAPEGCILDIAYAHVLDDGKIYYKTGHHYRNKRYTCKAGRQKWESFEFVNARFLQVTVRFPTPPVFRIQKFEPVKLYHIGMRRTDYPVTRTAVFSSDNELLNKLVVASDKTALTCINDKLVDNNYREKNNWSGDVSTVILPLLYMHGNVDMFRRYFRAFSYEQNPWGNFNIMVPNGDDWSWFDHSFNLTIRLEEYCTISGDKELAVELYPHVRRYLTFLEKYENKDGIIAYVPYCYWFDWANLNRKDINSTLNLLYLRLLLATEKLARWADAGRDLAIIEEKIVNLRKRCEEYFWNEEEGCLAEYRENGILSKSICEHSNALAISTGVLTGEKQKRMIERVFGRGMALNDNMSVIKVSPTFQYYAMKGLADAGREDLMLEFLEKRSGIFINTLGLDTIPEVWDIDVRTHDSFAQATPPESNMILSEIAGIKPGDCGFASFVLEPRFDLVKTVNATVPTNVGDISVSWSREADDRCLLILKKSDEAVCTFYAPKGWQIESGTNMDGCIAYGTEIKISLIKL